MTTAPTSDITYLLCSSKLQAMLNFNMFRPSHGSKSAIDTNFWRYLNNKDPIGWLGSLYSHRFGSGMSIRAARPGPVSSNPNRAGPILTEPDRAEKLSLIPARCCIVCLNRSSGSRFIVAKKRPLTDTQLCVLFVPLEFSRSKFSAQELSKICYFLT